jgi:hypothetical protein
MHSPSERGAAWAGGSTSRARAKAAAARGRPFFRIDFRRRFNIGEILASLCIFERYSILNSILKVLEILITRRDLIKPDGGRNGISRLPVSAGADPCRRAEWDSVW